MRQCWSACAVRTTFEAHDHWLRILGALHTPDGSQGHVPRLGPQSVRCGGSPTELGPTLVRVVAGSALRARVGQVQRTTTTRPSRLAVRAAAARPNKAMALTTAQVSDPNFKWAPDAALKAKALLGSREDYDAMYKESIENPNGFWSKVANEFHW